MSIENLKHKWHKSFNKSVDFIEGCLTPEYPNDRDSVDFSILANWLIDTQISGYEFMPLGYQGYKSNPFETEALLNLLHHALLDDGDVSFVKMKVEGKVDRIFMIFICRHEDYFRSMCLKENASDIRSSIDIRERMHNFMKDIHSGNPEKKIKPLLSEDDFTFEAHRDPILFIKELEEFQFQKQKDREETEEKMKKLRGNIGKNKPSI